MSSSRQRRRRASLHAGATETHSDPRKLSFMPGDAAFEARRIAVAKVPPRHPGGQRERCHFRLTGEIGVSARACQGADGSRSRSSCRSARRAGPLLHRPGSAAAVPLRHQVKMIERMIGNVEFHHRARSFFSRSVWVWTTIPSCTGVVQEEGVPLRPPVSTMHSRHEPRRAVCRWRGLWGSRCRSPSPRAGRSALGHADARDPVDGEVHRIFSVSEAGVPEVGFGNEATWASSTRLRQAGPRSGDLKMGHGGGHPDKGDMKTRRARHSRRTSSSRRDPRAASGWLGRPRRRHLLHHLAAACPPIRHGVHLPQLSKAPDSKAKCAISAMSAVSSERRCRRGRSAARRREAS